MSRHNPKKNGKQNINKKIMKRTLCKETTTTKAFFLETSPKAKPPKIVPSRLCLY
jgi:hypothetical protein